MSRIAIVLTLLLVFAGSVRPSCGQTRDIRPSGLNPDKVLSQYVHDVWNEDQGVPQSTIESIVQTHDGYIWIGTQRGLVRFDGRTFTTFDYVNTAAIRGGNKVQAIHVAGDGTLWIGFASGLVTYRDGVFTNMADSLGVKFAAVTDIEGDDSGRVWIATARDGLFAFDRGDLLRVQLPTEVTSTVLTTILPNPDGSVWLGTEAGLLRSRNGVSTFLGAHDGLTDTPITTLFRDRSGAVWIGTFDGIRIVRGEAIEEPPVERLRTLRAQQFLEDSWGSLWIATGKEGVFRLTGRRLEQFDQSNGLTHNQVESLFLDREGSLWVGTNGGGLNRLRDGTFFTLSTFEGLPSDMVFTVFEDSQGAMWFGTEASGVARRVGHSIQVFDTSSGLRSAEASSFAETPDGTIWIGTYGGGLHAYRNGHIAPVDGLSNPFIAALYTDRDGSLWIGTNGGLFHRTVEGRMRHYTTADGLYNHYITAIKQDGNGALWVGNWEGGLHRLDGDRFTHFDTIHGLPGDTPVMDIMIDADNTVWAATYGRGLVKIRDDRARIYTRQDGLFDELIYVILEASDGSLWMTCDNGIFRMERADFDRLDRKEIDTLPYTVFAKADGLRSKEMNGGLQPAGWKARDGRLWFPSIKGVAMIDPVNISRNELPPPVEITRFTVNGTERHPVDGMMFDPGIERIEFSFAALSFLSPERNEYSYQLVGYDDEPVSLTFDPETGETPPPLAVYTNLPNGDYEFVLRASNNDGVWNEAGTRLSFSIRPHFTATAWFRLLMLLGIVGVLMGVWKVRVRQLERRQQALERERDKAREANRFKTHILDNLNHEFRTPLTGILGYTDLLLQDARGEQEEFLGYIHSNGKRLLGTLDSLLELARVQHESHGLERTTQDVVPLIMEVVEHYRAEIDPRGGTLETELPNEPVPYAVHGRSFQYALSAVLSNAVKFDRSGTIRVSLHVAYDGSVTLSVSDHGPGIPSDAWEDIFAPFKQLSEGLTRSHEGTGVGLTIARHLMATMGGTVEVAESSPHGTTMRIMLFGERPQRPSRLGWAVRPDREAIRRQGDIQEDAGPVGS